jgi:hypothetical protein
MSTTEHGLPDAFALEFGKNGLPTRESAELIDAILTKAQTQTLVWLVGHTAGILSDRTLEPDVEGEVNPRAPWAVLRDIADVIEPDPFDPAEMLEWARVSLAMLAEHKLVPQEKADAVLNYSSKVSDAATVKISPDDTDEDIDRKVAGAFAATKAAIRALREQGGGEHATTFAESPNADTSG